MTHTSCLILPKKGVKTFKKLKENFGRNTAAEIFNRVLHPDFVDTYGTQLTLDEEGVPTYESLITFPMIRDFIGKDKIGEAMTKEQPIKEDSLANVQSLVNIATKFNKESKDYIGIVDYTDDFQNLTIKVVPRTKESIETAECQQKIQKLNSRIHELLSPIGFNIGVLSDYQTSLGRVGITEFKRAKELADDFTVMMQVANNMEGSRAVSEEFAHLIIGTYNQDPIVRRSIEFLTKNPEEAKKILGEEEYNKVSEFYDEDAASIAEEAAGHLLQQALIDRTVIEKQKVPILKRFFNAIFKFFKGLNPNYYQYSIDSAVTEYSKLAEDILSGRKTITKEDLQNTDRAAVFNALSEKVKAQIKVLKEIQRREFKAAALTSNSDIGIGESAEGKEISERGRARALAEQVKGDNTRYLENGESMGAITAYLGTAIDDLNEWKQQLAELDTLDTKTKFTVLKNAINTVFKYQKSIEEIEGIVTEEFLTDDDVMAQDFMVEDVDTTDNLSQYEDPSGEGIPKVDTKDMSVEEIADRMQKDAEEIELSKSEESYHKGRDFYMRVTKVIEADKEGETFDQQSVWVTPSTNIGTGVDELTRDFFMGRLEESPEGKYLVEGKKLAEIYPNASERQLQEYVQQLKEFKTSLDAQGITIIPRDVVAEGTIQTVDGTGKIHTVRVAGTVDLLGYDKDGNWHLYDMKTHRGLIKDEKKKKWSRQLSLYKQFLEAKYGINITEMNVIPISVQYPTPRGYGKGTTEYKVDKGAKPEGYNGAKNNQLMADGKAYRDAAPEKGELIPIEESALDILYKKLAKDPTNGLGGNGTVVLKLALADARKYFTEVNKAVSEQLIPQFAKFMEPFIGTEVKIPDPKKPGKYKTVPIEAYIEGDMKDIGLFATWLSTMADQPNLFLQMFDKVYKNKITEKRLKSIEAGQKITALGLKYEKLGIKSYDWMYEDDNSAYINKEYNLAAYNKAKQEEWDKLNAMYGKYPKIGSREYKAKNEARKRWYKANAINVEGTYDSYPNPERYPSKWDSLSETQKQFYNEWMAIKSDLDSLLGPEATTQCNTIKIRKSAIERWAGALKGNAITEALEEVKSNVMKSFDDTINYTASGIRGFDDREVLKLPMYYVHMPKGSNSKDLSRDAISTLIAYADMAYNYEAMSDIVNPLEIGREILNRKKNVIQTRGDKPVQESFTIGGKTFKAPIFMNTDKTNLMKTLDAWFNSKMYGQTLKDSGNIWGTNIDINKALSKLSKLGSAVQLGFNSLAQVANVGTGIAMQNIEAAAGEFFNAKELASADKTYMSEIGEVVLDLNRRAKQSKLGLVLEMFDISQKFNGQIKHKNFNQTNAILRWAFGNTMAFWGQEAGDHWLYSRTGIGMLKHMKVKQNGNTISIWDALETKWISDLDHSLGKTLVWKEGVTNLDGSPITTHTIADITDQIREVNHHLFGVYNEEDVVQARQYIFGRFLLQYRDWMPAQFRYRFGVGHQSIEGKRIDEGYYRTGGRVLKTLYTECLKGQKTIPQIWSKLDDHEKRNIKRCLTEMAQLGLVQLALLAMGSLGDDKDAPWATRMFKYMLTREASELGVLTPFSLTSLPILNTANEGLKILKSPFAATNVIDSIAGLSELFWIPNYMDTIQSGKFKGHSSAYRAFLKSPLSLYYNNIVKALSPQEATKYYNN